MKIEWEETHGADVRVHAVAGPLGLLVVGDSLGAERWSVCVFDSDSSEEWARDDEFVGTLDEAKARAVALGLGTLSPWVEIARAEGAAQEREACLAVLAEAIAEDRNVKADWDRRCDLAASQGDRDRVAFWGNKSARVDDRLRLLVHIEEQIRARGKDGAK